MMSQLVAGNVSIAHRIPSGTGAEQLKRIGQICRAHVYAMRSILQLIRHISLT